MERLFSFALFYTWLSFCILEKTMTGRRSNKRKPLGRASRQKTNKQENSSWKVNATGEVPLPWVHHRV